MSISARLPKAAPSTSPLPQELVDHVIDYLKDDFASLKMVGLLGRTWYRRTRVHLFNSIYLNDEKPKRRLCTLMNLLLSHSELVRNIKRLSLVQPGRKRRLLSCSELIKILPLLEKVTTLEIIGEDDRYPIDWSALNFKLQKALHSRMACSSLTSLTLINIRNLDSTPLAQYHNITFLHLNEVHASARPGATFSGAWLPLNRRPRSATSEHYYLNKLQVTGCGGPLKALLCCALTSESTLGLLRIKQLGVTAFSWDEDMDAAWSELLNICTLSVEIYTLTEEVNDISLPVVPTPPILLAIRRFEHLQAFHLSTSYHRFNGGTNSTFPNLLQELDQLSRSGNRVDLSKINILFHEDPHDDFTAVPDVAARICDIVSDEVWVKLGEMLTRSAFSALAVRISFDTTGSTLGEKDWKLVGDAFGSHMEGLQKRGAVVLSILRAVPTSLSEQSTGIYEESWIHRNTTREPHAQDAGATEVLQDVKKTLDGAAEVEVKPARERELDKYIKGTSRSVRNQMRLARQGVRGSGYNNLTPGDGTTQKKWRLLDANLKAKIEEFAIPTPPAPQNSNSECHPAPNQTAAPPRPATTALC
ncbi:hypothetical protein DFP72DRAFT_1076649 [Ephemerocybe angulata]|uniref:Uncharacterized protein n=1 Tax=Ephemerocybe angulata TaxID=980116 RepID=A0A8H6LX76_9AGAR|nr:hypothetical protein DFP72DRAFT_1076649 [Tulosesus angulatus]